MTQTSNDIKENKDTCFGNTLAENLEVIFDLGFEEIIREDIPDTEDQWMIFWKPGILLFCESYEGGKSMNSGNVYFNFDGPINAISSFSGGYRDGGNDNLISVGSFDIREGLRHRLTTMESAGTILDTWIERPFLWLLHYNDAKEEGYDYNTINADRISKLPQHIQTAISPA